jgi:CheY-like chemotaxis protein
MKKLRIAILEDSDVLLPKLVANIEATGMAEVLFATTSSKDFLQKISQQTPDAILLDIELEGDPMNGLDIANLLQLPVLFTSAQMKDYILQIEELNMNLEVVVEHVSKPLLFDKLKKVLPKFIRDVYAQQKSSFVYLDFEQSKSNRIPVETIVCLCTDKQDGSESNNKQIYFSDRKKATLIDFSFSANSQILHRKRCPHPQF